MRFSLKCVQIRWERITGKSEGCPRTIHPWIVNSLAKRQPTSHRYVFYPPCRDATTNALRSFQAAVLVSRSCMELRISCRTSLFPIAHC